MSRRAKGDAAQGRAPLLGLFGGEYDWRRALKCMAIDVFGASLRRMEGVEPSTVMIMFAHFADLEALVASLVLSELVAGEKDKAKGEHLCMKGALMMLKSVAEAQRAFAKDVASSCTRPRCTMSGASSWRASSTRAARRRSRWTQLLRAQGAHVQIGRSAARGQAR